LYLSCSASSQLPESKAAANVKPFFISSQSFLIFFNFSFQLSILLPLMLHNIFSTCHFLLGKGANVTNFSDLKIVKALHPMIFKKKEVQFNFAYNCNLSLNLFAAFYLLL
jgi:hypothetical protein